MANGKRQNSNGLQFVSFQVANHLPFDLCHLPFELFLDQNKVGMVNAAFHVTGDGDEPPLGIQDFQ
jgi:hypothetical protein